MSVLTGAAIRQAVSDGRIEIEPWIPEHVGPNSVDLRLGPLLKVYTLNDPTSVPSTWTQVDNKIVRLAGTEDTDLEGRILDMRKENPTIDLPIPEVGLVLLPGILYLGCTLERTKSDFFIPKVEGRSSVGRLGIKVHLTAGFGDIGFNGRWTLEIEVTHPIRVYAGERICQVYFSQPSGPVNELYKGRYQGDLEPRPSLFHLPTKVAPQENYLPFKRVSHVPGRGFIVHIEREILDSTYLEVGQTVLLGRDLLCFINGIEDSTSKPSQVGILVQARTKEGIEHLTQLSKDS